MTNDELLHKWVNNTISEAELEIFKSRPEYESLVELYQNTDDLAAPSFPEGKILEEILSVSKGKVKSMNPPSKNVKRGLPMWFKYGVAASLLIAVFYFMNPDQKGIVQHLANNEHIEGNLPDASTFVLNAGSSLSYDHDNWQHAREVNLDGEAFFKVEKGSTFKVNTSIGYVQVLGTQFNVRSYSDGLEVVCKEGLVLVEAINGSIKEQLTATDALKIRSDGQFFRWKDDTESSISWIGGITKLNDVTLKEVIIALEKQFEVKIESSGLDLNERLSCSFQHDDLQLALKTAMAPLKLQWKINDTTVILFK